MDENSLRRSMRSWAWLLSQARRFRYGQGGNPYASGVITVAWLRLLQLTAWPVAVPLSMKPVPPGCTIWKAMWPSSWTMIGKNRCF